MAKAKKNEPAGITDEQKELLTNLRDALSAALGGGAEAGEDPSDAGDDDGLGGDDDLGGEDDAATEEQVRAALKKVLKAKGKETVAKILKKFGAETLPELDAEKYAEVIKLAEKVASK
jgi:hypothetical protein